MTRFEFKLEKVLDLRKETEQERAQSLAAARREADSARQAMRSLEDLRRDGRERLTRAHGSGRSVGQLQNLEWVIGRLETELEVAQDKVREADAEMVERTRDFQDAVRDRQALDRLRDRKLEGWKTTQAREEQKAMDEVAITRHYRAKLDSSETHGNS